MSRPRCWKTSERNSEGNSTLISIYPALTLRCPDVTVEASESGRVLFAPTPNELMFFSVCAKYMKPISKIKMLFLFRNFKDRKDFFNCF